MHTLLSSVLLYDIMDDIPKEDLCKQCKELPREPGFERCMLCLKNLDTPVKVYRGIISGKIEKWRDERRKKNILPPATKEEIEQLKLERQRALLTRDINQAQEQTKKKGLNGWKILRSVVGSEGSPMHQTKSTKNRESEDMFDRASSMLDNSTGKNHKRDYSDLTG